MVKRPARLSSLPRQVEGFARPAKASWPKSSGDELPIGAQDVVFSFRHWKVGYDSSPQATWDFRLHSFEADVVSRVKKRAKGLPWEDNVSGCHATFHSHPSVTFPRD